MVTEEMQLVGVTEEDRVICCGCRKVDGRGREKHVSNNEIMFFFDKKIKQNKKKT